MTLVCDFIQEIEQQIAAGIGINELVQRRPSIHVKQAFIHLHCEQVEVLRWLVAHGADVNLVDSREWTPLMYTALGIACCESMCFLLDNGANVNIPPTKARPGLKRAVLDIAMRYDYHPFPFIHKLVQYGAKLGADRDEYYTIQRKYYLREHYTIHTLLSLIALATPRCLPRGGNVPLRLLPIDLLRKLKTYLLPLETSPVTYI